MTESLLARGDKVAATVRHRGAIDELIAKYGDRERVMVVDLTDTAWKRGEVDCFNAADSRVLAAPSASKWLPNCPDFFRGRPSDLSQLRRVFPDARGTSKATPAIHAVRMERKITRCQSEAVYHPSAQVLRRSALLGTYHCDFLDALARC
jgi:hypothetical protein